MLTKLLRYMVLCGVLCCLSQARQRTVHISRAYKFSLGDTPVQSFNDTVLAQILGAAGLNEEYMKMSPVDSFSPIIRNHDQACATVEVVEQLSEDYFPRFIRNYKCVNHGIGCKANDHAYYCKLTTIVKHILKKNPRRVLAEDDDQGNTSYFDLWEKSRLDIGVGCECSV